MALAAVKTWNPGDVLTAADLNALNTNILNNALTLISPLTGNLNFNNTQALSLVLEKLAAAPAAATQGRVWINTVNNDPGVDSGASPTLPLRTLIPQCRFVGQTSSQGLVQPYNGNRVPIKTVNAWETWPITTSSGIAVSSTYMTSSTTLYYAYLYNNAGTLSGLLSTALHSASTDTGVEVMTTDATRTLVGMCQSSTTAQFYSTLSTATTIASWVNRRPQFASGNFTADRNTASTSYVELNSEIRVHTVSWGDVVTGMLVGSIASASTGDIFSSIGMDGGTSSGVFGGELRQNIAIVNTAYDGPVMAMTAPAEGYHFYTLAGHTSTGQTGSWIGTANQGRQTLQIAVVV